MGSDRGRTRNLARERGDVHSLRQAQG
jgi:hypothetical protein